MNYRAVDRWARQRFKLKIYFYDGSTIDDIVACIDRGCPVMVIQNYHEYFPGGHGRVVTGCNRRNGVVIVNDVDEKGFRYRMPFDDLNKKWAEHARRFPRERKNMMIIFVPIDRESPIPGKKPADF